MPRIQRLLQYLVVLLFVAPGVAHASVTAGTIKGVAVDEGDIPIPGVMITVSSDNLMGKRQSVTDGNGRFLLAELPPGKYKLIAEKAGFAKIAKPGLQVNIGRNVILTITMPLSQAGEELVIEESRPTIDTESATRGSVLTKEFLDRIPAGRSYQQAVQMAAGVTGGANANIGGAGYNENTYMLDGVNITDPVTGTFSLNFNFDAIEQIEVLTSAFDPEYGYNLGGSINVVTVSGGNTLEVNTGLYYSNGNWAPKLDARYAADGYELTPTDFDSRYELLRAGSTIMGPIVRDKVWYITDGPVHGGVALIEVGAVLALHTGVAHAPEVTDLVGGDRLDGELAGAARLDALGGVPVDVRVEDDVAVLGVDVGTARQGERDLAAGGTAGLAQHAGAQLVLGVVIVEGVQRLVGVARVVARADALVVGGELRAGRLLVPVGPGVLEGLEIVARRQ